MDSQQLSKRKQPFVEKSVDKNLVFDQTVKNLLNSPPKREKK